MYEIVNVQYTGTYNNGGNSIPAVLGEFRASSAADLPAQNVDCHIICGCDGLDIATGDKYIWNGTAWILQPSDRAFSNVYTKPEIDSMTTEIYGIIAYYHTTLISDTGEITFYSLGGNVGTWAIYGNGQQTGTQTPVFVGARTAQLFDREKFVFGKYIDASGNEAASSGSGIDALNHSDFIRVTPNTTYAVNVPKSNLSSYPANNNAFCWFDSSKTILYRDLFSSGTDESTIAASYTAPAEGAYLVVNFRGTNVTTKYATLNSGSTALPYEPYGYKIPISCGGQTNNIYLSAPLRKAIDGTDAVDTLQSTGTLTRNVDENGDALVTPTTETITVPDIPTVQGENTLTVDTDLKPSKIEISGEG